MAAEFDMRGVSPLRPRSVARLWSVGVALVAVAALGLGGCSTVGDMFETQTKPKLPGERLSVMQLESKLAVDKDVAGDEIFLPDPVANDEWTQPGGNATNSYGNLEASGKLDRLWTSDAGSGSGSASRLVASPIISGGKIFVLDSEAHVRAFDAKSGDKLWTVDLTPEDLDSSKARGGGIAFDDGKLFAATGFGLVHALDPASGKVLWTTNAVVPFRASPTAANGYVYVITSDNQMICLDQKTGTITWRHRGITEAAGILAATSPAVTGSIVIAPYSSGELFALRGENGTVLWSDSLTRTGNLTSLSELNDIAGRPVVADDRVYAISHSGRFVSIDLRTGERVWTRDIAGVQTPLISGDYVFLVTSDQEVVGMSNRDGRIHWIAKLPRWDDPDDKSGPIEWSGPLLINGKLLLVSSEGQGVTVDPLTGKAGEPFDIAGSTLIAPVEAGGIVYILTDNGTLEALQ